MGEADFVLPLKLKPILLPDDWHADERKSRREKANRLGLRTEPGIGA
jgi:hypothetical protein